MNTVSYTLNKTVFVLDKDTGALKSLEYPGVAPMVCDGGGLFDAAWPVHNEYDIQRARLTRPALTSFRAEFAPLSPCALWMTESPSRCG